jgi:outer membrane protein OmpA-like peptidoglycan-associated protein
MRTAALRVHVAAITLLLTLPAWSALGQTRTVPPPAPPPPAPQTAPQLAPQPAPLPAPEEEPMPPGFPGAPPAPGYGPGPSGYGNGVVESSAPAEPLPAMNGAVHAADAYLPSLLGPIGLFHMATTDIGPVDHLRLALHGEYFKSSNFLVNPDTNSRMNGTFSFGFTPHRNFELFGALLTSSNRNTRVSTTEMPARRDPDLIKSFGDLVLGAKASLPVARGMTLGFELGFRFLSSISDLSVSPDSTSLWLGPLYMLDLRPLAHAPLRFHASVNYYVDNSSKLIDLSDMATISPFTREVAMFAYGIASNRWRFALGVDAPLEALTAPVPLQPFIEYHLEAVTASADPAFAAYPKPDNRDQQWLTFGLRARVYHGITAELGADKRIRSVGHQYGPPLPPYQVIFGVSYPFDIDAFARPIIVTRTIEKNVGASPADEGQVVGVVKSAKDGKPVAAALVAVVGRPLSRVGTDPDGAFQSVELPPGPVELEVTAAGFEGTKIKTAVLLGRPVKLDVALSPKAATGNVRGKVTDSKGVALQASLRFVGAEIFSAQADSSGLYSAALPVGPYKVTAEMPGMPLKEAPLDIVDGVDRTLDLVMRPANTNVSLTAEGFTLKTPIKFKAGAPRLDAKAQAELDAVADLMQEHPELRLLRIEAYWDSSGGKNVKALTDGQAKAVRAYLVKKGVSEARLEAVGMGADKPLVPNIGPVNKAKNRRIELKLGP